jgi:glutathione S-transferase
MSIARRRLYRHPLSGHSHRVQLMLSLLGCDGELVDVDLAAGAHKAPGFLALNAFGQVPVLEDGGIIIADSNAILVYLAMTYDRSGKWYPRDPESAANVQRWMSVAAGQLASGPASARLAALFGVPLDKTMAQGVAATLFALLESELASRPYLAGAAPTIADIALYSYTAHAPEGGISLDPYPSIRAWIHRIESLPGFVAMAETKVAA